jgi:type IV secretion system protein VirB2
MNAPTKVNKLRAVAILAALLVLQSAAPASAQGFTDFLTNVLDEFNAVRTPLATIALIIVGIAYAFNFFDLRKTAYAVIGIIIMFAAAQILSLITGG